MTRLFAVLLAVFALALPVAAQTTATTAAPVAPKLKVLIVDGVNNHDWRTATAAINEILLSSGRFAVDVSTSPPRGAAPEAWDAWRPNFSGYDAVVVNFNGGDSGPAVIQWPQAVRDAFEAYAKGGGSVVAYHAANNAFPGWRAYEEMVGLLWRGVDFGPSVIFDEQDKPVVIATGEGRRPGHGPNHDFEMTVLATDHPITRGFPRHWPHPAEQLTHGQHGHDAVVRSGEITYLTYAWSKTVNERPPLDWVRTWGKGRVYVTMLGHTWIGEDSSNIRDPLFRKLLSRGVEWAASGAVTLP